MSTRDRAFAALLAVVRRATQGCASVLLSFTVALRSENVPDFRHLGPVILAPNHASFLDPIVIQLAARHHLTFLMTEIFYRTRLVGSLCKIWGAIPLPDGGVAAGALKRALRAMRGGQPVVIFPEGKIALDGCLQEGMGGVVTLISRAQVPVIPVAILGTFEVLPRHARLLRSGRITIRFGDPIPPEPGLDRDGAKRYLARIMDEIHALGVPRRGTSSATRAADPGGARRLR